MRRKKCGGFLCGIVPALLVLFILGITLGTKNASALEYTQELTSTGRALPAVGDWKLKISNNNGTYNLSQISSSSGVPIPVFNLTPYEQSQTDREMIHSLCSGSNIDGLVKGNYYRVVVGIRSDSGGPLNGMITSLSASDTNFPIMSFKEVGWESIQDLSDPNFTLVYGQNIKIWEIIIQYVGNTNSQKICFGPGNDNTVTAWTSHQGLFQFANPTGSGMRFLMSLVYEYAPQNPAQAMNEKDDEDRQNIEQQQQENQDAADDNQDQVNTTTASMADVAGSIVGAVAQIHQTNCKLPDMTINGMRLENMDLCTFDTPPGLQALASVGMIFLMIPLSIRLIKRFLNLYREILG